MFKPPRTKDFLLSLVIPVYNEAKSLQELCERIQRVCQKEGYFYEIVFIDDGSLDNSRLQIENLTKSFPIKAVFFSRNFGKEHAISAGLRWALGDAVLLMDSDLQHPPELIPEFIQYWSEGFDNVYTVRESRKDQDFITSISSSLFHKFFSKISEIEIPPNAGDFRLLDRKVVTVLNSLEERQRYMKGLYAWAGFSSYALSYCPQQRDYGKTSFNLRKLGNLAASGVTSFSIWPLRLWVFVGCVVALSALFYGVFIFVETFIFGIITPGFPTLLISLLFLGGVQLISIGVVGEYVANIFNEVKRRPPYIIESTLGFENKNDYREKREENYPVCG
jgi:glycosyltransferase involved in cell wall biosynthesis